MNALRELTTPPVIVHEHLFQEQNVTIVYDVKAQSVRIQSLSPVLSTTLYSLLGVLAIQSDRIEASICMLPSGLYTVVVTLGNGQIYIKNILHLNE